MIRIAFFILSWCLLMISSAHAQSISLEECHRLARSNYPAIKKMDLISKTAAYDLQNASKKYLPQVVISGQATYQSEVVDYGSIFGGATSAMGITPPILSKDQYRIQGEVNQLLFDGGIMRNQKELIGANEKLREQNIEANLYGINSRINNIFFAVLLMEAQLKQNELRKANLETQVQKTEVALQNGVAFRSSLDELKAEIIAIEMAGTEYSAGRTAYLNMLSLFIGVDLSDTAQLFVPKIETLQTDINRPELKAFDLQKSVYTIQVEGLKSAYQPQLSAFFQGGYGRPTLNMIDNKFGGWYITGARFTWSLGSLYSLSNKRSILSIQQQMVDVERETFLFNTKLDLRQEDENILKYKTLIRQDEEAIALRAAVAKSAEAQLNNGVITTHEYIQKVNAEHLSRQHKIIHEIQLLQAKYNQKFITGNLY